MGVDMKKVTTTEDIRIFAKEHGCELVTEEFVRWTQLLEFKCACGNIYSCVWNSFKKGQNVCGDCSSKKEKEKNVERIKNLGYAFVGEYVRAGNKIELIDQKGYKYFVAPASLFAGSVPNFVDKRNPYSIENINLWIKRNSKKIEITTKEYTGGNLELIEWKCLVCNNIFLATWANIYSGSGCVYCAKKKAWEGNCLANKRPDLAQDWDYDKNGGLTPKDILPGSEKYYYWKCHVCDFGWKAMLTERKRGRGCPACSHFVSSDKTNLAITFPDLMLEWDYGKNKIDPSKILPHCKEKAWWICSVCGHSWYTYISVRTRTRKSNCPKCADSKGERTIAKYLRDNNFLFERYYKPKNCRYKNPLSFDFAIFNSNKELIKLCEYQGEQHFHPVDFASRGEEWAKESFDIILKRDKIKEDYCLKNNISFLKINYYDFSKIEEILNKELDTPRKEVNQI
jgi:hypothetical protein